MTRYPLLLFIPKRASAAVFAVALFFLASVGASYAQVYTFPANRITVWNPGLNSVGGIPSGTWPQCGPTLHPLGSGKDDVPQINQAIANCGGTEGKQVVLLGTGTFLIDPANNGGTGRGPDYIAIMKNVVLRGSGTGVTVLKNPNNPMANINDQNSQSPADPYPLVIIGPGIFVNPDGDARCQGLTPYNTNFMRLLSANGEKGTYSVTVASGPAIFQPGQFVLLDETSGAAWQPDVVHKGANLIWASSDYAVTWQQHQPTVQYVDDGVLTGVHPSTANNFSGTGNGSDAACDYSRQDRVQNEIKQIKSVSGSTITFTSPLHKGYRVSHYAELTTYTQGNAPVVNGGIENLTMVGGGDGNVDFENAAYSWAKNIESTTWFGAGVTLDNAFRVEVRDSYLHDGAWCEPGGAGYNLSLSHASSEVLIENNISVRCNKVMVVRASGAASVAGYNYMDAGYIITADPFIEVGLNGSHFVGSHQMLFEGNQGFNIDSDDTHGNSTYLTFFRNSTSSVRATFKDPFTGDIIDDTNSTVNGMAAGNGPKRAVGALTYSYWMNYVGNVLGASGLTTVANGYEDENSQTAPGDWGPAIWVLGWDAISPYDVDTKVAGTAIRDGNWDWFEGKQTWLTHPQDSHDTLPNSLYLPGRKKPAFFGNDTWPWVDPTTGTTYTLPAKARCDTIPGCVP